MKKRFLGLLAVCSLALAGLVGCGTSNPSSSATTPSDSSAEPVPGSSEEASSEEASSEAEVVKTVKIEDTLKIKITPPNDLILEDQHVRIENVVIMAVRGAKVFVQAVSGQYVSDIQSLETNLKEGVTLPEGAEDVMVNVDGIVKTVDGHTVLKDANFELTETPIEGHYYWPQVSRDLFDMFNREKHGLNIKGTVQLASVPTHYTAGTEQSFKVVFPGEDKDLTNEDNPFPITVTIPAELSEGAADTLNHWIENSEVAIPNEDYNPDEEVGPDNQRIIYVPTKVDAADKPVLAPLEVGDAFDLFAMYTIAPAGPELVIDGTSILNTEAAELEGLVESWQEVNALVEESFLNTKLLESIDLSAPADMVPYNYLVDDSMIHGQAVAYFNERIEALSISMYTYKSEELAANIAAQFDALDAEGKEALNPNHYETVVNKDEENDAYILVAFAGEKPLFSVEMHINDGYLLAYLYGVQTNVIALDALTLVESHYEWGAYFELDYVPAPETGEGTEQPAAAAEEPAAWTTALPENTDELLAANKVALAAGRVQLLLAMDKICTIDQFQLIVAGKVDDVKAFAAAYVGALQENGFNKFVTDAEVPEGEKASNYLLNPTTGEALVLVNDAPLVVMPIPSQPGAFAIILAVQTVNTLFLGDFYAPLQGPAAE